MKRSTFKSSGLYVEYGHHREGPPHQFICYYRDKSWLVFDPDKVVKQFKLGKGTPTREALTSWLQALELKAPESETLGDPSPDTAQDAAPDSASTQSWDPADLPESAPAL